MLNNLPQVTKNILILNIMFFVASFFLGTQGINLIQDFGAHYVNSPFFEPFQLVTHFFMHADFFHILFNMWLFVILGAHLEKMWGPKRFFIFYLVSAFAAFAEAAGDTARLSSVRKVTKQKKKIKFERHVERAG